MTALKALVFLRRKEKRGLEHMPKTIADAIVIEVTLPESS
jgi:hypothetical protein